MKRVRELVGGWRMMRVKEWIFVSFSDCGTGR